MDARVFTRDKEPPFGERIAMRTEAGDLLFWNGKRWHWGMWAHLCDHEAWPPDVTGAGILTEAV